MVVSEGDVMNVMGGMDHGGTIKLNDHKRKLKNRFEICRKLGQGTYGKVQLGINKETGQEVAIKTIKKSKIETEADLIRIRREIQIMSSVHHPNIIHIYEVFENTEKMVLVMEMAAGGELYDYLSDRKCLQDTEARRIFRQIATATYYCHKHHICHRDLKLENILLDEKGNAKIADFGLSNVYDGKNLLRTFCGSPLYASPEIVKGCPYIGPEVDCWSLGVLLYTLVYGAMPFDGSNFKRLVTQITTGDYYEPKKPSSASSLIRSMLTVEAEKRATVSDICSHWWVNDGYLQTCLEEAEHLASLTPVRLDLLLSLAQAPAQKEGMVVVDEEEKVEEAEAVPPAKCMSIVELPAEAGAEEDNNISCSVAEPAEDITSPQTKRKKEKTKRKLDGGESDILHDDVDRVDDRREATKPTAKRPAGERSDAPRGRAPSPEEIPRRTEEDMVIMTGAAEAARPPPIDSSSDSGIAMSEKAKSVAGSSMQFSNLENVSDKAPSVPLADIPTESSISTTITELPPPLPSPPPRPEVQPEPTASLMSPQSANSEYASAKPESHPSLSEQVSKSGAGVRRGEKSPKTKVSEPQKVSVVADKGKKVKKVHAKNASNGGSSSKKSNRPSVNVEAPAAGEVVAAKLGEVPKEDKSEMVKNTAREQPVPVEVLQKQVKESSSRSVRAKQQATDHAKAASKAKKESPKETTKEVKAPVVPNELVVAPKPQVVPEEPRKAKKCDIRHKDVLTVEETQPQTIRELAASRQSLSQELRQLPLENLVKVAEQEVVERSEQQQQEQQRRDEKPSVMSEPSLVPEPIAVDLLVKPPKEKNEEPHVPANAHLSNGSAVPSEPTSPSSPSSRSMDVNKSLINSVPRPFVAESSKIQATPQESKMSADSVASALTLSSSGSNTSLNNQNNEKTSIKIRLDMDGSESKVGKAAQFWNNYIGDVIKKSKPPENVKSLEKPKKIVSAGVGSRGMNDLKKAFEGGKGVNSKRTQDEKLAIMRRNSKKLNLEGCTPGLKVTDAKSVFESKKLQPTTPAILRRNSVNSNSSGSCSSQKWSKSKADASNLPFGGQQDNDSDNAKKSNSLPREKIKIVFNDGQNGVADHEKGVKLKTDQVEQKEPAKSELSKPATSPKPKVKSRSLSAKIPDTRSEGGADSTNCSNVCKIVPEEQADGLVPVAPENSTVPAKPQESALGSAEKVSDEARLAAVGIISREILKADPRKQQKLTAKQKQQSASAPGTPIIQSQQQPETPVITVLPVPKSAPVSPEAPLESGSPVKTELKIVQAVQTEKKPNAADTESDLVTPSQEAVKPIIPTPPAAPLQSPIADKPPAVVPKIKTITPEGEPQNKLEAIKNSLKHVPHAPAMGKKKSDESPPVSVDDVFSEGRKESTRASPSAKEKVAASENGGDSSLKSSSPAADSNRKGLQPQLESVKAAQPPRVASSKAAVGSSPSPNSPHLPPSPTRPGFPTLHQHPSSPLATSSPTTEALPGSAPMSTSSHVTKTSLTSSSPLPTTSPSANGPRSVPLPEVKPPERFIPIKIEGENKVMKKQEHLIPIHLEHSDPEDSERRDSFHPNSLIRRNRWGSGSSSRKKRFGPSFSSDSEDEAGAATPFGGLQRYSSLGKHGLLEEAPMFQLRKGSRQPVPTPFAMQHAESFSSNDDIFDDDDADDDFREMTAENLFSTLLSRVRNLTKRIHDEHEQHLHWQQANRIANHPLNPGGTHARLERNAQRNSLKKQKATPPGFSRQSSLREDGTRSLDGRGSGRMAGATEFFDPEVGVSVTSRQRLRPGYLPPPADSPMLLQTTKERTIPITVMKEEPPRQQRRRVSRFLRPDFYDRPKDEEDVELFPPADAVAAAAAATPWRASVVENHQKAPPARGVFQGSNAASAGNTKAPPSEDPVGQQLLTHQRQMEQKRLKHLHRQFSDELQSLEQDILQASLSKLRREAAERSADISEVASECDTESISSDILGALEDNNEMSSLSSRGMHHHRPRPVARRSISRELFLPESSQQSHPLGLGRPVTRRSISRELFDDVGWQPPTSRGSRDLHQLPDLDSIRREMRERERSMSREFDNFCGRLGNGSGGVVRPPLASQGRSFTQNEFAVPSSFRRMPSDSASLDGRMRNDWRRISVPERGQDFKSLPRKYNRLLSHDRASSPSPHASHRVNNGGDLPYYDSLPRRRTTRRTATPPPGALPTSCHRASPAGDVVTSNSNSSRRFSIGPGFDVARQHVGGHVRTQ